MRDYKKNPAQSKRRKTSPPAGIRPGRAFLAGAISGIALTLVAQNWSFINETLFAPSPLAIHEQSANTKETENEVKFEFYTRLPKMEVPIDTTREKIRDKKETGNYFYMLQVGSFDQRKDAERLKAQLALLGEIAVIQNVAVNGTSMHRVRLGPFNSSRKLDAVRGRLTREDIPTMALKIRHPD